MAQRRAGDNTNRRRNGRDATNGAEAKPHKPGKLDFKRGQEGVKKIVRENQQWLKEMANR